MNAKQTALEAYLDRTAAIHAKLARLAPDIVEDIARGRQPVGLSLLFFVKNPLPDDWNAQRDVIGGLAN